MMKIIQTMNNDEENNKSFTTHAKGEQPLQGPFGDVINLLNNYNIAN